MVYAEKYRSQLCQGPLSEPFLGAARGSTLDVTTLDVYGAGLTVSDKLRILSGQDCGSHADANVHPPCAAGDLSDDFAADLPIRRLGRQVLWHCECLYYQLIGEWVGERVWSLKQRFSNLPGPARAEVSYR
jgi:hypothetical protein